MEKTTYTYDDAFKAALDYFGGDELAARVWVNKYAVKDSFGNIYEKSPEDMHWRIANEIARVEAQYKNPMSAQEILYSLRVQQFWRALLLCGRFSRLPSASAWLRWGLWERGR